MYYLTSVLLQNMNPGKGTFSKPYDSTQGFTEKVQTILFLTIILLGLYVAIKVWWGLRKEKRNKNKYVLKVAQNIPKKRNLPPNEICPHPTLPKQD